MLTTLATLCCAAGCDRTRVARSNEQLLSEAWADCASSKFAESAVAFQQVVQQSQKPDAQAMRLLGEYGLATLEALGDQPEPEKAKLLFQQIVKEAPKSDEAAWSQLASIRIQQRLEGTDTAASRQRLAQGYREIIGSWPDTPTADEAFVHLQALLLISPSDDEARHVASDISTYLGQGKTRFAPALCNLRGIAYSSCHDSRQALDNSIASLDRQEHDPINPAPADSARLYGIGAQAQFDVGDFATARKFYGRLLKEYPTDQRVFTVKLLLKNMDKVEADLAKSPDMASAGEGP